MTNKYQFFLVADSDRSKDDIRVKKLADIPCRCTYSVVYCRIQSHHSCIPSIHISLIRRQVCPNPYFLALWYNNVASTSKPNCWAVLPVGNQVSVTVAIHDRLFVLDPYEAVLQVLIDCM